MVGQRHPEGQDGDRAAEAENLAEAVEQQGEAEGGGQGGGIALHVPEDRQPRHGPEHAEHRGDQQRAEYPADNPARLDHARRVGLQEGKGQHDAEHVGQRRFEHHHRAGRLADLEPLDHRDDHRRGGPGENGAEGEPAEPGQSQRDHANHGERHQGGQEGHHRQGEGGAHGPAQHVNAEVGAALQQDGDQGERRHHRSDLAEVLGAQEPRDGAHQQADQDQQEDIGQAGPLEQRRKGVGEEVDQPDQQDDSGQA